jgi:hypothetical protein
MGQHNKIEGINFGAALVILLEDITHNNYVYTEAACSRFDFREQASLRCNGFVSNSYKFFIVFCIRWSMAVVLTLQFWPWLFA